MNGHRSRGRSPGSGIKWQVLHHFAANACPNVSDWPTAEAAFRWSEEVTLADETALATTLGLVRSVQDECRIAINAATNRLNRSRASFVVEGGLRMGAASTYGSAKIGVLSIKTIATEEGRPNATCHKMSGSHAIGHRESMNRALGRRRLVTNYVCRRRATLIAYGLFALMQRASTSTIALRSLRERE